MEHDLPARVLVAPDSFKGTLAAWEVAAACARGLTQAGCEPEPCPVADGGEGTMRILIAALGGEVVERPATGPRGRPLEAALGIAGADAIVEVAEASGLALLDPAERDPERASTAGTGELIAAALELGADHVMVAAGGSATVDGGAGAIAAIRASGGLGESRITVLCDVETPFEEAATVYGPQKGATPAAVGRLTAWLEELASELPKDPRGLPLSGAAGGLSGGLWAAFDADLVGGADFVLQALEFDRRLDGADAVTVGEGNLDGQSFQGKAIGQIAERCRGRGVPVHAIVGGSELSDGEAEERGLASVRVASSPEEIAAAARELGASL